MEGDATCASACLKSAKAWRIRTDAAARATSGLGETTLCSLRSREPRKTPETSVEHVLNREHFIAASDDNINTWNKVEGLGAEWA